MSGKNGCREDDIRRVRNFPDNDQRRENDTHLAFFDGSSVVQVIHHKGEPSFLLRDKRPAPEDR